MKLKIPIVLAITLAFAPSLLFAQQKQPSPKPVSDPFGGPGAAPLEASALDQARFDVEFVETPISDACAHIAELVGNLTGRQINIVVSKEAEDIALPKMELKQITFEQWVSFINRIGGADALQSGGAVNALGIRVGDGGAAIPHKGPSFGMTETDGIWYFWAEKRPQEPPAAPVKLSTRVFPLDGDTEAILGLIEEALTESRRHGENPQPTLKFHEPSGTLIATGSAEDLALIEEVVDVMETREVKLREAKVENAIRSPEIREMERELADLLGRMTPDHPSVVSLRKRLEQAIAESDQNE